MRVGIPEVCMLITHIYKCVISHFCAPVSDCHVSMTVWAQLQVKRVYDLFSALTTPVNPHTAGRRKQRSVTTQSMKLCYRSRNCALLGQMKNNNHGNTKWIKEFYRQFQPHILVFIGYCHVNSSCNIVVTLIWDCCTSQIKKSQFARQTPLYKKQLTRS